MTSKFILSESDLNQLLLEKATCECRKGYITVEGVCLPEYYQKFADKIENFEVRDDDVWVCSFPKTGTTWTQEMVWCIANDLDFEKAKINHQERFPFLEISALFDYSTIIAKNQGKEKMPEFILDSVTFADKMPSPRFIKTHLPFHLLPKQMRTGEKKPKIIYVHRNVKDTCISYFHHYKLLERFSGTFEEFCILFLGGKVNDAPFWKHVLSYWERRNQENILIFKYEDMKADLRSVINKTSKFLGKEMLTENKMKELENHLSFENMKNNPAVNFEQLIEIMNRMESMRGDGKFMRCGKVNQWKERMSEELIDQFDTWTEECLKNTGFTV